ncbi:hypothetical protein [Streptomyces sp. NPDC001903]|uniref:hypothetical protein n=1 Tax=Streptomyces sp. NPDC001903 TaxID=3364622 RepID=UPI0036837404
MKGILRRLADLFRCAPPAPPPAPAEPLDEGDWWGPSWIWEPGDLDDEEGGR